MTVKEFYGKLCELYPTSLSCAWDNDGLMVSPDTNAEIRHVLVALDVTDGAIAEAKKVGADLILTHHPIIFRPLKSLTRESSVAASRAISAFTGGISVISLHTRLDAGDNGVNDALASRLGLANVEKFGTPGDAETLGRIGDVTPSSLADYAKAVKEKLGAGAVSYSGSLPVRRVAVVGGSGGDFFASAKRAGADTVVTGEAGFNLTVDTAELGLNVITAGHFATENPVCEILSSLASTIACVKVTVYNSNTIETV